MDENPSKEEQVAKPYQMGKKTKIALAVGGSVVAGVVSMAAIPLVIYGAGFGVGGIYAGSVASYMMSSVGSVAAGSTVALLQSAGVLGVSGLTSAVVGTTVCATIATSSIIPIAISNESKPLIDSSNR